MRRSSGATAIRNPIPPLFRAGKRPVSTAVIITHFAHVFQQAGIPSQYWDRRDMVILQELARLLRQYCRETWLIIPAIREGDTVEEAARRVRRLLDGLHG